MAYEQKNDYGVIFDKVKQFKKDLDAEGGFNEYEKKILFEKYSEQVIAGHEGAVIKESALVGIPSSSVISKCGASTFASLKAKAKVTVHKDIVLLATYYLIIEQNYESITVKDIKEEYKKAYLKPSANPSVDIRDLVKLGLMMPIGKKAGIGTFSITQAGMDRVTEVLNNG